MTANDLCAWAGIFGLFAAGLLILALYHRVRSRLSRRFRELMLGEDWKDRDD